MKWKEKQTRIIDRLEPGWREEAGGASVSIQKTAVSAVGKKTEGGASVRTEGGALLAREKWGGHSER